MKKGILIGLGTLFIVTSLVSGCSKPEEKKTEAPPVEKQMVPEKAPAVKQEMAEKTEATGEAAQEKTETISEQAVETAKEMGQQAIESAVEKMPEEVQQAVGTVKQYSGGQLEQATAEGEKAASPVAVPEVEAEPAPSEGSGSVEQTLQQKAAEQGMKLPGKY